MITRRTFGYLLSGAALASGSEHGISPDQAHRELVQGNLRFASGHTKHPHSSKNWARKTSQAQHPHAIVLCCSDSRVVPEILFDCGIGDIFTVRVAGNVANEDELASIEYAVEHLGVTLCVVLGHSSCGAVRAVVDGESLPIEIDHLVAHIREAHQLAKAHLPQQATEAEVLRDTIRNNVLLTVDLLKTNAPLLRERLAHHKLRIEGAVYDLSSGQVTWTGS